MVFRAQHLVFALSVATLSLVSCQSGKQPDMSVLTGEIHDRFSEVEQITTTALADWLADEARKPPILIDTRSLDEYEVSHIQGAIPGFSEESLGAIIGGLPKEQPIVVYCSVGYRSAQAAQRLQRQGFGKVYNLEGSIFQWANEGRPVYAGGDRVKKVHPYNENWGRYLQRDLWSSTPKD